MKKHQKHTALTRPNIGNFHRQEWAIIGTPCDTIQRLSREIIESLSSDYKVGYIDADHAKDEEIKKKNLTPFDVGASQQYTDKISFHRFDQKSNLNSFQYRNIFNGEDAVLVNGNHFLSKQQILVIDPKKEKSLQKKLDRLTDVILILFIEGINEIPAYLQEALASQDLEKIPTYKINDISAIADFLKNSLQKNTPILNGLVLAGGKSRRMGRDKGKINYHGKPQREYAFDLLAACCEQTFLSCRPDQSADPDLFGMPLIFDSFLGLGPFGAIASAFRENPNSAWLVVACDLPLLDQETLEYLIKHRDTSRIATAFNSPDNEFPEPLITIWEPRSYPILLSFLAQGYSCPRKVLINSEVALVDAPDTRVLTNVNSPEDFEQLKFEE